MIFEMITVGGIFFWVLVFLFLAVSAAAVENDSLGFATMVLIVFVAILTAFSTVNIFVWMRDNPLDLVMITGGYFFAGTGWAFIRWYLFLLDERDRQDIDLKERLRSAKISFDDITYKTVLKDNGYWYMIPKSSDNRSRIILWMAYWPISVPWTFMSKFVRRVFVSIYNMIGASLQRMSDKVFAP